MSVTSGADRLLDHALHVLLVVPEGTEPGRAAAALRDEVAETTVIHGLAGAAVELGRRSYDAVLLHPAFTPAEATEAAWALSGTQAGLLVLLLTEGPGAPVLWSLCCPLSEPTGSLAQAVAAHRSLGLARRAAELSQGLLDALDASTCAVDATAEIVVVNAAWHAFAQANGGHAVAVGSSYLAVCDTVPAGEDAADGELVAQGLRGVLDRQVGRFEHEYPCHGPDEQRWFTVRITPAEVRGSKGAVIIHVDVTAMHLAREALAHQVLHDSLTGLPNRVLLGDRLEQAMADAQRSGRSVGVGYLDLDGFKEVNDTLGHTAGDLLLQQVARRLRSQLRGGDTVARPSGDEFVLVWCELASPGDVTALSERVVAAMREPFDLNGVPATISASIGIAVGGPPQTAQELITAANGSMYDAKRHGRGQVRVFRAAGHGSATAPLATDAGLRRALSQSELVLHYQPVIDLPTGRPVGVEALMRWQHPDHGLLAPGLFIPQAEETGMILALGRWALLRACEDASGLVGPAAGLEVAVNISAVQLVQPSLVGHVREALVLSGLDPARLILEVTESAVVDDEMAAALALEELSRLGVRLAVDDFGTGYSSLLYLRRYPFRTLKLDRAFVGGLGRSSDDEAISKAVISLAHAVGATSVGEGVETAHQLAALHAFGCDQAQGFLWSRAVPLDELPHALARCLAVAQPVPTDVRVPPPVLEFGETGAVRVRILAMHRSGASLHTIAGALNRDSSRTATGPRWTAAAVARLVVR